MRLTTILMAPAPLWVAAILISSPLSASPAAAQSATRPPASPALLREFSASVEELAGRVSPSVVQIVVTGYGPVDERSRGETGMVIGRQRSIGSGAIIDADGYIITNAHVVAGAKHVQVILHRDTTADGPVRSLAEDAGHDRRRADRRHRERHRSRAAQGRRHRASGRSRWPTTTPSARANSSSRSAVPEGLRNSVTMGVVSAVARQPDPDQADDLHSDRRADQSGNSGGPLVNVDGELVGLNTLILSESGGSQGLGFAIPSAIVASAFPQLQKYGHLHRGLLGFGMQAITPTLAAALELPRTTGVMVSDVMPDGPAETAGLGVKDLIAAVERQARGQRADAVARVEPLGGGRHGRAGRDARDQEPRRSRSRSPSGRTRSTGWPISPIPRRAPCRSSGSSASTSTTTPPRCCRRCAFRRACSWPRARRIRRQRRAARRRRRDSLREHAPGEEPRRAAGVSRPRRRQSRPGAANRT